MEDYEEISSEEFKNGDFLARLSMIHALWKLRDYYLIMLN